MKYQKAEKYRTAGKRGGHYNQGTLAFLRSGFRVFRSGLGYKYQGLGMRLIVKL